MNHQEFLDFEKVQKYKNLKDKLLWEIGICKDDVYSIRCAIKSNSYWAYNEEKWFLLRHLNWIKESKFDILKMLFTVL